MPTSNDDKLAQSIVSLPAAMASSLNESNPEIFHGIWYKYSRAAISIVDIVKAMSVEDDLCDLASCHGQSMARGCDPHTPDIDDTTYSGAQEASLKYRVLLAVLQRLGRIWASANAPRSMPSPE
jgi:hypothetical protein